MVAVIGTLLGVIFGVIAVAALSFVWQLWETKNRKKKVEPNPPAGQALLMGDLDKLVVSRPFYKDTTRNGTKLEFCLNICNLGDAATMIKCATITATFNINEPIWVRDHEHYNLYERIEPGTYRQDLGCFDGRQVYVLGKWHSYPIRVYFDEFSSDSYMPGSVVVELTDEQNIVHRLTAR